MKKIISLALLLSIFSNLAMADCPPSVLLKQGDRVTDCARVGLSLEYDEQVRKDLIEGDYNKHIAVEQQKIIELKDLQIRQISENADLWKQEAKQEREALDKERNKTNWGFWGGLIGGVALTVLAGWAVGQVSR